MISLATTGLFSSLTLLISVRINEVCCLWIKDVELTEKLHLAPVCTTELGLVAALQDEFDARGVKVIGLSANELESHEKWIADINEVNNVDLKFPIIADPKREISALYDMLDYQVSCTETRYNNTEEHMSNLH